MPDILHVYLFVTTCLSQIVYYCEVLYQNQAPVAKWNLDNIAKNYQQDQNFVF